MIFLKSILELKKLYFYRKFLPYRFFGNNLFYLYNLFLNKTIPAPAFIDFDITSRCNLNCKFCYFRDSMNKYRDLTTDEIMDFLNTLKKGTYVILSGGEPFIRKDIFQIISNAKKNKLKVGLFTNGLLLNSDKCDMVIKSGLDQILFSIHGFPHYHDTLTGVKDATNKIIENIKLLDNKRKNGKPNIYISSTITEDNTDEIEKVSTLAQNLKIDGFKVEHLNFSTNECIEKHKNEINRLFKSEEGPILHTYKRGYFNSVFSKKIINLNKLLYLKNFFKSIFLKPIMNDKEITEWYSGDDKHLCKKKCFYVLNSIYISPDGSVHPCQFYEYSLGNIKNTNIYDIWDSNKLRVFRNILRNGILPGCYRCCKL